MSNKEKNAYIEANKGLVGLVAKKYLRKNNYIDFNDLLQEGILGMYHAVEKFDVKKGVEFGTYAMPWIRVYIENYIGRIESGHMSRPTNWGHYSSRIISAHKSMKKKGVEHPSSSDIAKEAELSKEVIEGIDILRKGTFELDRFDPRFISELVGTDENSCVEQIVMDREISRRIRSIFKKKFAGLDDMEKRVLVAYFGLDGKEPRTACRVIGKEVGKSYEYVRQVKNRALEKIAQGNNEELEEYYDYMVSENH